MKPTPTPSNKFSFLASSSSSSSKASSSTKQQQKSTTTNKTTKSSSSTKTAEKPSPSFLFSTLLIGDAQPRPNVLQLTDDMRRRIADEKRRIPPTPTPPPTTTTTTTPSFVPTYVISSPKYSISTPSSIAAVKNLQESLEKYLQYGLSVQQQLAKRGYSLVDPKLAQDYNGSNDPLLLFDENNHNTALGNEKIKSLIGETLFTIESFIDGILLKYFTENALPKYLIFNNSLKKISYVLVRIFLSAKPISLATLPFNTTTNKKPPSVAFEFWLTPGDLQDFQKRYKFSSNDLLAHIIQQLKQYSSNNKQSQQSQYNWFVSRSYAIVGWKNAVQLNPHGDPDFTYYKSTDINEQKLSASSRGGDGIWLDKTSLYGIEIINSGENVKLGAKTKDKLQDYMIFKRKLIGTSDKSSNVQLQLYKGDPNEFNAAVYLLNGSFNQNYIYHV